MVQTKLIKLIGLVFFVCCNSYAQTAPPLQNPNTMVIGPYPNADGYFPIGLEGDHGNNKLDKTYSGNSYSNNNTTNITIREFFNAINYKVSENSNNPTETGKILINKYSSDAEKGSEDKMLYMALTYRIYLQDTTNEIVWLDKLVAKNNDYAMIRRGDIYEDAKDISNSIALYQKAVQLGNSTAMVGLAEKYILHVRSEINKPVELLTAATEKNNIEACMELANLYTGMYGKQYPLDNVKALNLYLKYLQLSDGIKNNKDVTSQRSAVMKSIATLYKNGDGVAKDNVAYRQWMKKAKTEDENILKRN